MKYDDYLLTDWHEYKYGIWRRVGHYIQVCADYPIMPFALVAAEFPTPLPPWPLGKQYKYEWQVRVKGWTNRYEIKE